MIRTVCNDVLQPDVMDRIADSVIEAQTAELNQPNPEKEALQHELADVQRKAKNLLAALENGTAGAMLTNRLAELERQANTLSYQLRRWNLSRSSRSSPRKKFCTCWNSSSLPPARKPRHTAAA